MSENDKDSVYNLLTNTLRSGTKVTSAIYIVDTKKTNTSPDDLTTDDFCHNYYSIIAHDERSYADTDIVHPNQTSPYVPSMGGNMVYTADPNRAAVVDNFLWHYLEQEFGDLPEYLPPMSKNNNNVNLMITQLAPAIPSINFHACAWNILIGLCSLVTAVLCPIFTSTYFQLPVSINVVYVQRIHQHLHSKLCGDLSYSL